MKGLDMIITDNTNWESREIAHKIAAFHDYVKRFPMTAASHGLFELNQRELTTLGDTALRLAHDKAMDGEK